MLTGEKHTCCQLVKEFNGDPEKFENCLVPKLFKFRRMSQFSQNEHTFWKRNLKIVAE